uniref:Uncharacterized protein n=1 Tax=Romanomermis culicivorax TaxID=13658 RepID=A0A915KND8_ROMCU
MRNRDTSVVYRLGICSVERRLEADENVVVLIATVNLRKKRASCCPDYYSQSEKKRASSLFINCISIYFLSEAHLKKIEHRSQRHLLTDN